ncbi:TIGR03667 family PPOX class F420-dependent oxidoreductase [Amycolatopsis anabasis]|uniref:TIGR03667 family PPOX class F420-dependent oxidoreductase n=1 Tax=Amycolatopsis anabasis TaxID=1840409 RepID=UPI00131E2E5D|nr:TIGR03667 family PPOX class F420-dependent oxidoreductase [Amycolatopsis anabasis]
MTITALPDPSTPFGERVRTRLRDERLIWWTTVGADGTPQPNPVWFLQDDDGILIYNRQDAHRLNHIRERPQVSLNFDAASDGGDIVVLRGRARQLEDQPLPHENPAYLEKYAEAMVEVSGSPEEFSAVYFVPVRIEITRVRGF